MYSDTQQAFGPLTALVAKRKRALSQYEATKHMRWHGERHMREARMTEIDIRFAFFIGE